MSPVEPKPASTLLALKDVSTEQGSEMQVFMIVRHKKIDFASGALVFPGGKVAEGDFGDIRNHCIGQENYDDTELALRVSAIRETFEESGLLFARYENEDDYIKDNENSKFQEYRKAINAREMTFSEFVQKEKLQLTVNELVPFSHWITPEMVPKRFDTHFYITSAPSSQVATPDGHESVDAIWIEANEAVRKGEAGELTIILPTKMNLQKLGENSSVDGALERLRKEEIKTIMPWTEMIDDQMMICLPPDAGFAVHQFPMEKLKKA